MKRLTNSSIIMIMVVAMTASVGFLQKAEARGLGGGGGREDFQREGSIEDPRGGEAVEGPYGRKAAEGPNGGGEDVLVAAPREGVGAAVAVGTRIAVLPETATQVAVADQVYYVDSDVYYQACDDSYCVVTNPQDQGDQNNE